MRERIIFNATRLKMLKVHNTLNTFNSFCFVLFLTGEMGMSRSNFGSS